MVDPRLFRIPSFTISLVVYFLAIFVSVGYLLFIAQYLQMVLGLSPLRSGLWSLPPPSVSSSARSWPRRACAWCARR